MNSNELFAKRRLVDVRSASQSRRDRTDAAHKSLIDAFGHDNVYVEIQRHFVRGEEQINQR